MYRAATPPSPLLITAANGVMTAFDRRTGAPVWVVRPEAPLKWPQVSRVVADELRVVAVSAQVNETGFFASADGAADLICVEYLTGRLLWRQRVGVGLNVGFFTATLMIDQGQVFLVHGTVLAAFALDTGAHVWSQEVEGSMATGNRPLPVALCVPGRSEQADR